MSDSVSSTESASASAAAEVVAPASPPAAAEKPKPKRAAPGPVPVNWPYEQADWEDADIRYEMNVPEPCLHGEKCWNKGKNGNGCAFVHPREAGTGYIYFPEREVDGVKQKECVRIVGSSLYYERRRLKMSWADFVSLKWLGDRSDGASPPSRAPAPRGPPAARTPHPKYATPAPTRLSDFLSDERMAPGALGPKPPAAAMGMPRAMLKEIMRELLFEEAPIPTTPQRPTLIPRPVALAAAGGGGNKKGKGSKREGQGK